MLIFLIHLILLEDHHLNYYFEYDFFLKKKKINDFFGHF